MLVGFALPLAIGNVIILDKSEIWERALHEEGINTKLKECCHLMFFSSPTTQRKVVFSEELASDSTFYVVFIHFILGVEGYLCFRELIFLRLWLGFELFTKYGDTLISLNIMLSCSVMSNSVTLWTRVCQTPLTMGLSRQEYWSGLPFPNPSFISYIFNK